jgi:hypothetical protein
MGVIQMSRTSSTPDHGDPQFVKARAFDVISALASARVRLEKQKAEALSQWSKKLSDKTKEYREILRDPDHHKAGQKAKAGYFDDVVELVQERDQLNDDKLADMKARKAKIAKIDEADAEAKSASRSNDGAQMALLQEASKIDGMPWATDGTLGVVYAALLYLDEAGADLDDDQRTLLQELAEVDIEGADLGLAAEEAIEDDSDVEEFDSEDDEEVDLDDEPTF